MSSAWPRAAPSSERRAWPPESMGSGSSAGPGGRPPRHGRRQDRRSALARVAARRACGLLLLGDRGRRGQRLGGRRPARWDPVADRPRHRQARSDDPAAVRPHRRRSRGRGGLGDGRLDDTLSRIDPSTNAITATIAVGRGAGGLAVGAGSVWVVETINHAVARVDPRTLRVVDTIPVGSRPDDVAAGRSGVWVTAHRL